MATDTVFPPPNQEQMAIFELTVRKARHQRLRQVADAQLAQRLQELSHLYPNLGAGPLTGAALAGIDPRDPAMAQLAIRSTQADVGALDNRRASRLDEIESSGGSWFGWSALKGVTRAVTLGFEFLWEEGLVRPLRTAVGVNQGLSLEEAYSLAGSSDALRALQGALAGERVNIGSGFFARSTLSPETERLLSIGVPLEQAIRNDEQETHGAPITQLGRQQRETGIQLTSPGGVKVAVSPGRLLAINFAEPGTKPFGLISGMTDFSANIFLDPSNLAFLGAGKLRAASRALVPDSARPTFLSRTWTDYVTSRDGRQVATELARETDYQNIYGLLKGAGRHADIPDAGVAASLTRETDPTRVGQLLVDYGNQGRLGPEALNPVSLTGRLLRGGGFAGPRAIPRTAARLGGAALGSGTAKLGGVAGGVIGGIAAGPVGAVAGAALGTGAVGARAGREAARLTKITGLTTALGRVGQDTYLGWLAAKVGARGLSVRDRDQAVLDWGQNLRLMDLSHTDRSELMIRLAESRSATEMYGVVRDGMEAFAKRLEGRGMDPDATKALTRLYGEYSDFRAYWLNQVAQPQYHPGANVKVALGEEVITMPSAMLFSEMIEQYIPILDPRKVRGALRRASRQARFGRKAFTDWDKVGQNAITRASDFLMNDVWKPLVLLRVAWPVRVISEEQLRMAAMGLNSAARHPFQWLAMVLGSKGATDALGNQFDDSMHFSSAMSRRNSPYLDRRSTNNIAPWARVGHDDPRLYQAMFIEYHKMLRDPLAVRLAQRAVQLRGEGATLTGQQARGLLDDVKEAYKRGDLRWLRQERIDEGGRLSAHGWDDIADGYVDAVWARMNGNFGGDFIYFEHGGVITGRDPGAGLRLPASGRGADDVELHSTGAWKRRDGSPIDDIEGEFGLGEVATPRMLLKQEPGTELFDAAPGDVVSRQPRDPSPPLFDREQQFLDPARADLRETMNDPLLRAWRTLRDNISYDLTPNDARGLLDDFYRALPPEVEGRISDEAFAEINQAFEDIQLALSVGDPSDVDSAVARMGNLMDDVNVELGAVDAAGPPRRTGLEREFVPTAEALRAAGLTRDEFTQLFSSIYPIGRYQPFNLADTPFGSVPDGTYTLPGVEVRDPELVGSVLTPENAQRLKQGKVGPVNGDNITVVIRDGHVVGQLSYQTDVHGNFVAIKLLQTANESSPLYRQTDVRDLFQAVWGPDVDGRNLLDLAMVDIGGRRITFEQLLRAQMGSDELDELNTTEEILAALRGRERGLSGFQGPEGAEAMTEYGARALRTRFKALGRSDDPNAMARWPQHREQYVITEVGDFEIIESIATGQLRGNQLVDQLDDAGQVVTKGELYDGRKGFNKARRQTIADLEDIMPRDRVTGRFYAMPTEADDATQGLFDEAVRRLFDVLMGARTDQLARSPAFRQFYWNRMAQLYDSLDADGQAKMLENFRNAGLDQRTVREWFTDVLQGRGDDELAQLSRLAGPGRRIRASDAAGDFLTLEEADQLAKSTALHEVRNLLYDISRKSNFFDITRHIFPFGEAWLEIITRWAQITNQNPRVLRRLQQAIEGGRESGFFYPDPQTNEEVFNYPGGELISKWMFDDPSAVNFSGRLGGVNLMVGAYMPGVGPVVQIPASTIGRPFLEQPEQKFLRELLLPFGFQDIDSAGDVLDSVAPAWLRKALVAIGHPTGDDQRLYNNTVKDVLRYLDATGQVDLRTRAGYEAALADAQQKATWLYFVRAASQFAGPTGARPRLQAQDLNGQLWSFTELSTEYRKILEDNQFSQQAATTEFINLFGFDPTRIQLPKTRQLVRRSTTEFGAEFEARNPDLFNEFPLTAFYLRPDDPDEAFDYNAYIKQLHEGTRVELSDEQWILQGNDLLGRLAYERAREVVGDRTDFAARQWLRQYRLQLMERYEGYNSPIVGLEQRGRRDALIREFEQWAQSPAVIETDAGTAMVLYLEARRQAMAAMVERGLTPNALFSSNAGKLHRDWLRLTAQKLVEAYPAFGAAWVSVLSREIEDDEPSGAVAVAGVNFNV